MRRYSNATKKMLKKSALFRNPGTGTYANPFEAADKGKSGSTVCKAEIANSPSASEPEKHTLELDPKTASLLAIKIASSVPANQLDRCLSDLFPDNTPLHVLEKVAAAARYANRVGPAIASTRNLLRRIHG